MEAVAKKGGRDSKAVTYFSQITSPLKLKWDSNVFNDD